MDHDHIDPKATNARDLFLKREDLWRRKVRGQNANRMRFEGEDSRFSLWRDLDRFGEERLVPSVKAIEISNRDRALAEPLAHLGGVIEGMLGVSIRVVR